MVAVAGVGAAVGVVWACLARVVAAVVAAVAAVAAVVVVVVAVAVVVVTEACFSGALTTRGTSKRPGQEQEAVVEEGGEGGWRRGVPR